MKRILLLFWATLFLYVWGCSDYDELLQGQEKLIKGTKFKNTTDRISL